MSKHTTPSEKHDGHDDSTDFRERYGFRRDLGYGAIEAPSLADAKAPYINIELSKVDTALLVDLNRQGVVVDVTAVSDDSDLKIGTLSKLTPRQAEDLAHDLLAAAEEWREWAEGDDEQ